MKDVNKETPIHIDKFSHDGRGIAHINDKITFVFGALPHETVTLKSLRKHRHYNEADTSDIIDTHPQRALPHCEHFSLCGGCSLQHADHSLQITMKQEILKQQFQQIAKITPQQWLAPLTGPQWGYRRKARLGVKYVEKKSQIVVGFRERIQGRFIADLQQCHTLDPRVGFLITPLKKLLSTLHQLKHIPQIEVAMGDEITALIFRHLRELDEYDLKQLQQFAKDYQIHLYLQPHNMESIHRLYPTTGPELLSYCLKKFNLEFWFHPSDFTQINAHMNQLMVDRAIELLKPESSETILDLFCGLGNFTLPIAKYCHRVIGVEGSSEMVKRATFNAQHNNIHNTEFYYANLMDSSLTTPWLRQTYDKILLDPPRTGAIEIIQQFPRLNAKRIVYVSCNPATLARDTAELIRQNYSLTFAGIIDMFPQTSHVEAIATFDKD